MEDTSDRNNKTSEEYKLEPISCEHLGLRSQPADVMFTGKSHGTRRRGLQPRTTLLHRSSAHVRARIAGKEGETVACQITGGGKYRGRRQEHARGDNARMSVCVTYLSIEHRRRCVRQCRKQIQEKRYSDALICVILCYGFVNEVVLVSNDKDSRY